MKDLSIQEKAAPSGFARQKRIPVGCKDKNRATGWFLLGTAVLTVISIAYLGIDWGKLFSRIPDIGVVFWKLLHLDFSNMDLIGSSLLETVSIAVLSLLYSLILGVIFGMLAAKNVFRLPVLSVIVQSFFTFLRAVPTPVWVLLMLVCLEKACTKFFSRSSQAAAKLVIILAFAAAAWLLHTDYDALGIGAVAAIYLLRGYGFLSGIMGCLVLNLTSFSNAGAFLSLVPLACYSGRRGWKLKYAFYLFYPAHLLLLYLIRLFL